MRQACLSITMAGAGRARAHGTGGAFVESHPAGRGGERRVDKSVFDMLIDVVPLLLDR